MEFFPLFSPLVGLLVDRPMPASKTSFIYEIRRRNNIPVADQPVPTIGFNREDIQWGKIDVG